MNGDIGDNPFPILEGRYGKIDPPAGKGGWVEDVFSNPSPANDAAGNGEGHSPGFIGLAAAAHRITAVFFVFFAIFCVIFFRVVYLTAQGNKFRLNAASNSTRLVVTPAARGVIFDAEGKQLVENVPDLKLALIPSGLPKDGAARDLAFQKIAGVIGSTADEINAQLNDAEGKDYEPVTVSSALTHDEAVKLSILKADLPFIDIVSGSHRYYTESDALPSLSHLLGYMGKVGRGDLADPAAAYTPIDSVGKTGLESSYEKDLRGAPGVRTIQVDAFGKEKKVLGTSDGAPGGNLRLNIDSELTAVAENSLKTELAKNHLDRGAVVVMDAAGGAVRALVSLPAYSDNLFAQGISSAEYGKLTADKSQPLFSRAISGNYPSGSTVKLVLSAAAAFYTPIAIGFPTGRPADTALPT
jgi:penicillin-binding protein 2